jgi:hypothetical protein
MVHIGIPEVLHELRSEMEGDQLKEKTSTGKPPNKQLKHQPIKSTYYVCLSRKIKTYASEQTTDQYCTLVITELITFGRNCRTQLNVHVVVDIFCPLVSAFIKLFLETKTIHVFNFSSEIRAIII